MLIYFNRLTTFVTKRQFLNRPLRYLLSYYRKKVKVEGNGANLYSLYLRDDPTLYSDVSR